MCAMGKPGTRNKLVRQFVRDLECCRRPRKRSSAPKIKLNSSSFIVVVRLQPVAAAAGPALTLRIPVCTRKNSASALGRHANSVRTASVSHQQQHQRSWCWSVTSRRCFWPFLQLQRSWHSDGGGGALWESCLYALPHKSRSPDNEKVESLRREAVWLCYQETTIFCTYMMAFSMCQPTAMNQHCYYHNERRMIGALISEALNGSGLFLWVNLFEQWRSGYRIFEHPFTSILFGPIRMCIAINMTNAYRFVIMDFRMFICWLMCRWWEIYLILF